jgi:Ni/Co efflux regulator RcnB
MKKLFIILLVLFIVSPLFALTKEQEKRYRFAEEEQKHRHKMETREVKHLGRLGIISAKDETKAERIRNPIVYPIYTNYYNKPYYNSRYRQRSYRSRGYRSRSRYRQSNYSRLNASIF